MGEASHFNPIPAIARKRDGLELTAEEIAGLVRGYVAHEVSEHQMAALAMAICLRGMTAAETLSLTEQLLNSGATLQATDRSRRVDKHSTGGIGDKSSFILAPLLACCGLQVPMISGRALGATGGTLDKLESIPGLRTDLSAAEIEAILDDVGCVITGATADLVPGDRQLYALRDVTATVPSIPLMTSSIMSKKVAECLSALVLDVKVGSGAFMKSRHDARVLAQRMVQVGTLMDVKTTALLTSMDQPNGRLAGNVVEIDESLDVLTGSGPADLKELVLELGGELLVMKDLAPSLPEAKATLEGHLTSGRALERFRAMIAAQGGALEQRRTRAASWTLTSNRSGFVSAINGEALGLAIVEMGGGRQQLGQQVDHAVGLEILVRLGDYVERGQGILTIFASTVARSRGLRMLEDAIQIRDDAPSLSPLILERIRPGDVQQTVVDVERGQRLRLPELVGSAGGPPAPGDHGTGAAPDRSGRQRLIEAALHAREAAYAPYSQFRVGAAVVSKQGNVYLGANVENASYGLTICAERVALSNAIAAGEREFKALAIASPGGVPPCGACRQFAAEFEPHLPLILVDADLPGRTAETDLGQLLPGRFELRQRLQQDARDAGGHEAGQGAAQHGPQPEAG